ncbi:retrovirus-related pol polyprotein from transposon TNT 1-94 [Tanacetum coccineum]
MVFVITSLKNDLRKVKGKETVANASQIPSATTIALGMFKLDLVPLAPRLLQNRDAHIDYLITTQEHANILREIVEQAKAKQPLDTELDYAYKHAKRTQELLIYVRDTCPNAFNPRLKGSTSASGSNPFVNTKNNRISQPPSIKCNDDVMQSTCNANSISDSISNASVKNSVNAAKSDCLCAICGKCMMIEIHDKCVVFVASKMNIVLWYLDSGCSKHMTGNRSQLMNFVSKFLGTVRFENDQIASIMGYGDYQLGNVVISRVCYVEGLGHNLFSVSQFCDADLEVAFWKNTCFIRNLEGVDLLSGSRHINLYTISLDDMLKSSPICLVSKVSKTKSWLWNRRLSHLNFNTLNNLAKDGLAQGLPKLKF